MNKPFSRITNKILYSIGLLLGFSSFAAAQYGAPVSLFKINGNIFSNECNEPIKNIRISVTDKNDHILAENFSDSIGNFSVLIKEFDIHQMVKLKFEDIDGRENHAFQSTFREISASDYKTYIMGNWEKIYEKEPYNVELYFKDDVPCKKEPEPNQKVMTNEYLDERELTKLTPNHKKEVTNALPATKTGTDKQFKFNLYPNPNEGSFTIEFNIGTEQDVYIQLYNSIGQFIKEEVVLNCSENISHNLNTENLKTGIYNLHLITDDKVYSKKFIIKR